LLRLPHRCEGRKPDSIRMGDNWPCSGPR
jgi:hypothetical protein